jgi:hypothetical protein
VRFIFGVGIVTRLRVGVLFPAEAASRPALWGPPQLPTKSLLEEGLFHEGRATAQAVSGSSPGGICGGRSGTGAGFLRVLRLPLPILIPPTVPHSSSIIRGYNRPNSGRRTKWTQSHPTPRN